MQKNTTCTALIREIEQEYRLTGPMTGKYSLTGQIKNAIQEVPRHEFVSDTMRASAYRNSSLPIGHGQTMPQPSTVALMIDLLGTESNQIVLEIGTGCGYQAAVLSRLVKKIFSIEIIPSLAHQAQERLQRLGFDNVEVREGNGFSGLDTFAPYDRIILTAATHEIPTKLLKQLKAGGKMVLPIGCSHGWQYLTVVTTKKMAVPKRVS